MRSMFLLRLHIITLMSVVLLLTLAVSSAAAHSQIVTPTGQDAVVSGPISNAWAQAHCRSNAPNVVADASDRVVQFLPAANFPCPEVPNPGGQIHDQ